MLSDVVRIRKPVRRPRITSQDNLAASPGSQSKRPARGLGLRYWW